MSSYQEFEKEVKLISNLGNVQELLVWDQEVIMPDNGIEARKKQKSAISTVRHQRLASDKIKDLIDHVEKEDLNPEQQACLREIKREHRKAREVPDELMEKMSEKESTCVETWRKAREENDFESYADELEELVKLKRKYAEYVDPEAEPYKVLFKDYEPYIKFETMEQILERLKQELSQYIDTIRETGTDFENVFEGSFDLDKQRLLSQKLVEEMGFDFDHGRLDESTHPFTNGNQFDTRITTRLNENDLSEGLGATVHECGHALYQLGLPREKYGTPVGEARDLSVHESQSRLWENHVMRSRSFWDYFLPELKKKFPDEFEDVEAEDCYRSINQVKEDNLIRIYADELTYHLHIVVRFELGRKLLNGEIEVEQLPELWDEKMKELLGIAPETDSEGVMQDIHWAWGGFGYFTTYTLGSVLAAQIYGAAEEELDGLERRLSKGDFDPLRKWLRENIHSQGKRYKTEELIERITGEKPNADHFINYIREKYGEIYGVEFE